MDTEKIKKIKSGKSTGKEMCGEQATLMSPVRSRYQEIIDTAMMRRSVRCSSTKIHYLPYMSNLSGSIIVNAYDTRYDNPQKALLIHTSFPANHDQFLNLHLNAIIGPRENKDPIRIEIFPVGVDVNQGANYSYCHVKTHYDVYHKRMKGGIPSLESAPPLIYTRGDLLPARYVETLTRMQGFLGPPLERGSSYVLEGSSMKGKLLDASASKTSGNNKEYQQNTLEEPPITV